MKKGKSFFATSMAAISLFAVSCGGGSTQPATEEAKDSTVVVAAPNTLTEQEIADGWQLLFNGDSINQFKGYCKDYLPSAWQVSDGTIYFKGSGKGEAGGAEGGDIITKEVFGDFELSMEWKISEGGNSGIFYLAKEVCPNGDVKGQPIYKSAPEMQILDNVKHPDAKLGKNGNRQAGSLYDMIPADPQNAKPAGEWNQIKITSYKGTIVHWMNGETVVEYHLWTDDWKEMVKNSKFDKFEGFVDVAKEGHIGLQDHGDDVWFRNLKIRKL